MFQPSVVLCLYIALFVLIILHSENTSRGKTPLANQQWLSGETIDGTMWNNSSRRKYLHILLLPLSAIPCILSIAVAISTAGKCWCKHFQQNEKQIPITYIILFPFIAVYSTLYYGYVQGKYDCCKKNLLFKDFQQSVKQNAHNKYYTLPVSYTLYNVLFWWIEKITYSKLYLHLQKCVKQNVKRINYTT